MFGGEDGADGTIDGRTNRPVTWIDGESIAEHFIRKRLVRHRFNVDILAVRHAVKISRHTTRDARHFSSCGAFFI